MGRGYNPYPNAYLYRDWVIKAFNDDLPYDQFVQGAARRRSAGDEDARADAARRSASSASARGSTTTARSRSRAPTSGTIASTSSRAASSASPSAAPAATITSTTRFRPQDYYSLAGVFLTRRTTSIRSRRRAVVDEYNAQEKKIEKKEKLLDEFLQTESAQLAETLALQSVEVHAAAWKVTGEPKEDDRARSSTRTSSITSCSIAGSSSWPSRRSSIRT